MEVKHRKTTRLQGADYNSAGSYFITICTQDRRCVLSRIVGTGVLCQEQDCKQLCKRIVYTFKRFCNKEYGANIWQYRSNDHIIRNRKDYEEHSKYIYENPSKWYYDELYSEEEFEY